MSSSISFDIYRYQIVPYLSLTDLADQRHVCHEFLTVFRERIVSLKDSSVEEFLKLYRHSCIRNDMGLFLECLDAIPIYLRRKGFLTTFLELAGETDLRLGKILARSLPLLQASKQGLLLAVGRRQSSIYRPLERSRKENRRRPESSTNDIWVKIVDSRKIPDLNKDSSDVNNPGGRIVDKEDYAFILSLIHLPDFYKKVYHHAETTQGSLSSSLKVRCQTLGISEHLL